MFRSLANNQFTHKLKDIDIFDKNLEMTHDFIKEVSIMGGGFLKRFSSSSYLRRLYHHRLYLIPMKTFLPANPNVPQCVLISQSLVRTRNFASLSTK